MLTKNELIVLYGMRTLDYEKDPNPEHWRTISGAKVHLDNNGEIDGGAGGNFNGNYWDGKKGQQHVVGPHTMMKKNIGSGATMFKMAAMGAFNNKVEPTKVEPKPAEPKPAKKPKAPKEPAFEFPQVIQRTKPKPLDTNSMDGLREQRKRKIDIQHISQRSLYDNESHPSIRVSMQSLSDSTGIPLEELQAPKTPEQIEAQFGSAFTEANNAKEKPFTKAAIKKYQEALESLKNSDPQITEAVLSGINVRTLEKEPEEVYNIWMNAAKLAERLNNEKKNGITSNYAEWKKSVGVKDKYDRNRAFLREMRLTQTDEELEKQAKIYKPEKVVGVSKGPDMDFNAADHKSANPHYRMIWDSDYKKGYRINCQTCVIAYEMRRRGYNVEALPRSNDNWFQDKVASWGELDDDGSAKAWIRPDGTHPVPKQLNSIYRDEQYKWLGDNMEEDARYTFCFCWKGRGAHIIHAFKENGVPKLYDPQNGNLIEDAESVKKYLDRIAVRGTRFQPNPRLTRIDDCAPNMFYVNRVLTPAK
jgi:hypothetical protein